MSKRERLPDCRAQITDSGARWPLNDGRRLHISVGLSPDCRCLEVFARGGSKTGSDLDFTLDDAAILLSRLLQHGDRLEDIARGLSRLPDGRPSSVVGVIVDKAREIEGDLQRAQGELAAEPKAAATGPGPEPAP
jgi:hypothetical protein